MKRLVINTFTDGEIDCLNDKLTKAIERLHKCQEHNLDCSLCKTCRVYDYIYQARWDLNGGKNPKQ